VKQSLSLQAVTELTNFDFKNYGIYEQHYDCPPQITEGTGKAVE
jgi:hypothetical protein